MRVYRACDHVPQSGPQELLLLKDELDAAWLAGAHHRLAMLRQLAMPAEDVRWWCGGEGWDAPLGGGAGGTMRRGGGGPAAAA